MGRPKIQFIKRKGNKWQPLEDFLNIAWNSGVPFYSGIMLGLTQDILWVIPFFTASLFRIDIYLGD